MTSFRTSVGTRIKDFRKERGYSIEDFASLVGVKSATILRWETSTSRPSPLAAERLNSLGLGVIEAIDTNVSSRPRLHIEKDASRSLKLRDDIRPEIMLGDKEFSFTPSPYVVNGPSDQIAFHEEILRLQEHSELPCDLTQYASRLSLVASVDGVIEETAVRALENPKPSAVSWSSNYGTHGWHRYVGRFPPHLIRAILNHFGAKSGEVVLDPFAGSGTTLVEARLLGLKGLGIEICPLSAMMTRSKSQFLTSTDELKSVMASLPSFYKKRWEAFVGTDDVLEKSYEEILARPGNQIEKFANYEKWFSKPALIGCSIVVEYLGELDGITKDTVACALSAKMRSIGNLDVDVVRAEYRKIPRENVDVLGLVMRSLRGMIKDVEASSRTHGDMMSSRDDIQVIQDSVLDTYIEDSSVDYVVTSPPYGVESLSYLRTHLLSYRALHPYLGYNPYQVNDKIIGSEFLSGYSEASVVQELHTKSPVFEKFFEEELSELTSGQPLKRKIMMMKFFLDMDKLAKNLSRWLKPQGKVAFVIGNKKIDKKVIPTAEIIKEIFAAEGLSCVRVLSQKLKTNNSNSQVPWQERIIQDEFTLFFEKSNSA